MHRPRSAPFLLAFLLALVPAAGASAKGEPWAEEPAFKTLAKHELKVLHELLQTALKKDYRRQAWYLAERIAAVAPGDEHAVDTLEKWTGKELAEGQVPKKAFLSARDKRLEGLGDEYFHFGEVLEASGMDPETYYPINVRAQAYGSRAGPLIEALHASDYVWLGTYGPQPRKEVEACLGAPFEEFTFPAEFDDEFLKAKALWPEARGAEWGTWRLITDHDHKETLRLLGVLAAAERWLVRHMGSKARPKDTDVTNLLVFSEWQKYDKIGFDLIRKQDEERFADTSGWHDYWNRRLLVCWRHRFNGWLGDDDLLLGHAAKVMARRHLAAGAGGMVQGRGAWLLDGLRGAFEGFRVNADGAGEIDAGSCWRLAVARALREQGLLIPWKDLFELDQKRADALDRPTLTIKFGGAEREAVKVDVPAAQGTALVVGMLKAEKGKGAKKLAKLIGDLFKRDSLPDVDKAMGWRAGRAVALAEEAIDAAHGLAGK